MVKIVKIIVLAIGIFTVVVCPVMAQTDFETLEIPFKETVYIIQEGLENSAEELLLTLLFTSDPEIAENENAKICEFESEEIEATVVNSGDCDAVRVFYRYAPSPIPADAQLIYSQLKLGSPAYEFIYSNPEFFEESDPVPVVGSRFSQRRNEIQIMPRFFGQDGAVVYDETVKSPVQIVRQSVFDRAQSTKERFQIKMMDARFDRAHFAIEVGLIKQYVHRDFSNADWSMVDKDSLGDNPVEVGEHYYVDGTLAGGSGGGGNASFPPTETYDGPDHKEIHAMAFNDNELMFVSETNRLYRMNWTFPTIPVLQIGFTLDGKSVLHWAAEVNHCYRFRVDFPGVEKLTMPE